MDRTLPNTRLEIMKTMKNVEDIINTKLKNTEVTFEIMNNFVEDYYTYGEDIDFADELLDMLSNTPIEYQIKWWLGWLPDIKESFKQPKLNLKISIL